nr:MAG TPA: hypothetical protein [Caudoviricetes sp.]
MQPGGGGKRQQGRDPTALHGSGPARSARAGGEPVPGGVPGHRGNCAAEVVQKEKK